MPELAAKIIMTARSKRMTASGMSHHFFSRRENLKNSLNTDHMEWRLRVCFMAGNVNQFLRRSLLKAASGSERFANVTLSRMQFGDTAEFNSALHGFAVQIGSGGSVRMRPFERLDIGLNSFETFPRYFVRWVELQCHLELLERLLQFP